MTESNTNGHSQAPPPTASDLLQRCQTLLNELETFKEYLKSRKQDHQVEIAHFRNTVKSELRTLQRLTSAQTPSQPSTKDPSHSNSDDEDADAEEKEPQTTTTTTQHTVNSSNLPFLETVWGVVKNNTGLVAMQKRFYWQEKGMKRGQKKQNSALVDVVAGDGLEWFKVSLLSNNRLLFDKAKLGWEDASSSEEEDDDDEEDGAKTKEEFGSKKEEDDNDVPLVKMTKDLVRAAKEVKIRTRSPRITLVLPKLREGEVPEIDRIMDQLRSLGANLLTSSSAYPPTSFASVMPNLLTDPFASFTQTLNIDCTILLALVSDFSHCAVTTEPWFHRALKRQVEIEDEENLLPNLLFPALANRTLICTDEAAKRMREIVDTIGTVGEKERTRLFMGDSPALSAKELRAELEKQSRFEIPESLQLPILVQVPDAEQHSLPASAEAVKKQLTSINQSVFLHGWAKGVTTVTSNRTVVKQMENTLAREASDEKEWPLIWMCPTARSLVGKEKGRREG